VDPQDPTWTCVAGGNALDFDGTDDEVRLSNVTIGNSAAWSISAWIKMGADSADQRTIYSEGNTAQTEYLFLFVDDTGSNVRFYSENFGASNWTLLNGTTNVEDDAWHLVTVVQRSKTDRELYVDGLSEATDTNNAGTLTFDTASIGFLRTDWVADPFLGSIDDVRIYDYALSPAEISALAASPPGPCALTISGTVSEDVNGDANLADAVVRDNVSVVLYRDGGDGLPDGVDDGAPVATTTTDISGNYTFSSVTTGDYWVLVDSKTVSPSAGTAAPGDVWAEQTYGTVGARCDDGTGATVTLGATGPCYGGQLGTVSDNASALATAQHVTAVPVSTANVTGVDFAFSFNAVINTFAGDAQDDDGGANRTVQGSLRQFVQNANAITGANAMRFVPAVPTNATGGGGNWWRISVTTALPPITGANTALDGRAYSRTDGVTVRNDNPNVLGTGGLVGVGGLPLSQVPGPELELVGDTTLLKGLDVRADNFTIRRFAIYGFGDGVDLLTDQGNIFFDQPVVNMLIEENVLGSSAASFSDPGVGVRTGGANIWGEVADNGTIRNNLIGFGGFFGILLSTNADTWTVENNEVRANGLLHLGTDGIDINGGTINTTVRGNLFAANRGSGVDMFLGGGTNLIENNTITGNGIGGTEDAGMRVLGDSNTIRLNIITTNAGSGVMIINANSPPHVSNRISQNAIFNNGKLGIDLHTGAEDANLGTSPFVTGNDAGDTDGGANQGQNYPIITSAIWNGANTVVSGTLNSTASTTFDIEVFSNTVCNGDTAGTPTAAPGDFGEGEVYRITDTQLTDGSGNASFTVNIPVDLSGQFITSAAINTATNDTSEFSQCALVVIPAAIELSAATASDAEASGGNKPVLLINGTLTTAQTIEVNITGGTATPGAGNDFTNTALVNIPAGTYDGTLGTAVAINLTILDDAVLEGDETIDLQLANPSIGLTIGDANTDTVTQSTHIYTITDDDTATVTVDDVSAVEGTGLVFTVTLDNAVAAPFCHRWCGPAGCPRGL
jgi:hypothetical protein